MLAPLALALAPAQVQEFPSATLPTSVLRLGREVAFRQGTSLDRSIRSVAEGDASSTVLDSDHAWNFPGGYTVWQGRFVYSDGDAVLRAVGPDGSAPLQLVSPAMAAEEPLADILGTAGQRLFVNARLPGSSLGEVLTELWVFDALGVDPVRIPLGDGSQGVRTSAPLGDHLFFIKSDPGFGAEPWISDGTVAGTQRLLDAWPGSLDGASALVPPISDGDRVWYAGQDPAAGQELWVTDGTTAGTQLAADVSPGPVFSNPVGLTLVGDRIAFRVTPLGQGQVWTLPRSGGPAELLTGAPETAVLISVDTLDGPLDTLYLSIEQPTPAENVLWRWNGPGTPVEQLFTPEPLKNVGTSMVQVASDGTVLFSARTTPGGAELWRVGGGGMGPEQVVDLAPGSASSNPGEIVLAGDRVLWRAKTGPVATLHGLPVGDLALSSIHPLGLSCDNAATLSGTGLPAPGAAITLELSDGAPGTFGALLLGRDLLPSPAIGPCGLGLDPTQVLGLLTLDASGAASLPITVPAVPALSGRVYRVQHVEVDAGGPVLGGFRTTNLAELLIGN